MLLFSPSSKSWWKVHVLSCSVSIFDVCYLVEKAKSVTCSESGRRWSLWDSLFLCGFNTLDTVPRSLHLCHWCASLIQQKMSLFLTDKDTNRSGVLGISLYTYIYIWMCVCMFASVCVCLPLCVYLVEMLPFIHSTAWHPLWYNVQQLYPKPWFLFLVLSFWRSSFMSHFAVQKSDFTAVFFQRFPLFMMVEELANASHTSSKKAEVSRSINSWSWSRSRRFFMFLEASLMNVECLGLQHWAQAQSSGS